MQFEFRLNINDFKEFNQIYLKGIFEKICLSYTGLLIFMSLLSLALKGFVSFRDVLLIAILPNLVIGGGIYIAFSMIKQFSIKFAWENLARFQDISVDIRDRDLTITTPLSTSTLQWTAYKCWQETQSLFLLYQSRSCSSIFPKRAFSSDGEIDEFREILCSKLPQK